MLWIKYFIVLISAIGDGYLAYLLLGYFVRKFELKKKSIHYISPKMNFISLMMETRNETIFVAFQVKYIKKKIK